MSKNVNNDVTMNPPIYNVGNVKTSKSFTLHFKGFLFAINLAKKYIVR